VRLLVNSMSEVSSSNWNVLSAKYIIEASLWT